MDKKYFFELLSNLNQDQINNLIDYAIELQEEELKKINLN